MKKILWVAVIFTLCASSPLLALENSSNTNLAANDTITKLQADAQSGDALAQYRLGLFYYTGKSGLTENKPLGLEWLHKSADQGNAKAKSFLVLIHNNGTVATQDTDAALKEYLKLAEQGDSSAQYMVGRAYYTGKGVPANGNEAVKWYQKSAEQGNELAQSALGGLYHAGYVLPKNDVEAAKWYEKAADQGNSMAQYAMGASYAEGAGVQQNFVISYKWFLLAKQNSKMPAAAGMTVDIALDAVKKSMTGEQIAEATRMAQEWKPSGNGR